MKKLFCVTLCLLLLASVFAYAQNENKARSDRAKKAPQSRDPFGSDAATDPFAPRPKKAADPFGGADDRDPFGADPKPRSPRQPVIKTKPPVAVGANSAPDFPVTWLNGSAARTRIEKALSNQTTFDYLDQPLSEVAEDISYRCELPILLDERAMDDFGIAADTPITANLKGVSLRSALKLALKPHELTYMIRDEVLMITTTEEAESTLSIAFYRVADLLPESGETDWLVDLITSIAEPDTWDEVGGPGSLLYIDHLETLVIWQTDHVHTKVRHLLGTISKLPKKGQ